MIGNPNESDYKAMVSNNMIRNCHISQHDVSNGRNLFCPQLAGVRRKTTRSKPAPFVEEYVAIRRNFVLQNKTITLSAGVFFVDQIALLLTLSCRIKFVTVEHTTSCTAKQSTMHLKCVLRMYYRACFIVRYVFMDNEFEKVKKELSKRWRKNYRRRGG